MKLGIVVNGDSYTHERHFAVGEDYVEKTWAYSIGAENIALGGCSNDRIFHSTINYLNSHNTDVLILGWTLFDRYFMTHTNGLNLHITPSGVANDNLYGFKPNDNPFQEYHDFYFKKMHNQFLNFQNFIMYYKHLEKYCASNNIKYLNFCSLAPLPSGEQLSEIAKTAYMSREDNDVHQQGILHNTEILTRALETFDKKHWINQEIGFCYKKHVDHLPKWPDGHPGREASALWAKIIRDNLSTI